MRRALVLLLTAAACALLLTDFIRLKASDLVVGEVATSDVVAPFSFQFEDEPATQTLRVKAAEAVPLVYDHDATLRARLQNRVTTSFEKGRSSFLAASLAELAEPDQPELQPELQPEETPDEEAPEQPAPRELPDEVIGQLGQEFATELGLSLKPE